MRAARGTPEAAVAGALALATLASLLLRTGALHAGYWIDEAISVGIASHHLADIPAALRQDGSPPLYYLLLHGWMAAFGSGEPATRALSLAFAGAAVPVAFRSGSVLFGRRAGWLAAAGAAGCPFLTYYAQETRMYALVALLSVLACTSFARAFVDGRRRELPWLWLWTVLLLYTHTWGVFLAAGMAVAAARRPDRRRDALRVGAAVAVAYAPWVPTLIFQAAHTGAPWADRPGPLELIGVPGGLFGYVATPVLALAAGLALRRRAPADPAVRALVTIAVAAAGLAFLCSQVQPAWSSRYLAILFGPLLLALAATLARGSRGTAAALVAVAAIWLLGGPPPQKSNARTVAADVRPALRAGDLVVSTQPEQVPVLARYLPGGILYLTPLGVVGDPRLTDWRDGVERLRGGHAETVLLPIVDRLAPGRRILLVTPVYPRRLQHSQAPWNRGVRARTREWRAALAADPRLRAIGAAPRSTWPLGRGSVRAQLLEVRR